MKYSRCTTALVSASLLSACSNSLEDYHQSTPTFSLQTYFSKPVTAWGIVQNYADKLTRRFCVDIVPQWQGNQGQLHETFYYDDGEQQVRIWSLSVAQDGTVSGTADDVIGQASGSASGAAFNWQYTLRVPVDGTSYDLFVDDWMFNLDNKRLMNRSYLKKLGITVAEVSIFFDNSDGIQSCQNEA